MQSLKLTRLILTCAAALGVLGTGCALFQKHETTSLRFHEQVDSGMTEGRRMTVALPSVGLKLSVSPFPVLTERDVQAADIVQTAGGAAILLRLDIHGTMALEELTTRCRGQHIVVFLNDRPAAAWLVDKRITTGQFLLEGDFTDAEARRVVDELNRQGAKRK